MTWPDRDPITDGVHLPLGLRIKGYRIESLLGRGGMGEVYLARDEQLDRLVALKRIRMDLLSHPDARPRFRREARLAARLNHPRVVQIYGFLVHESDEFLVQEYVPGSSLAEVVRGADPVAPATAVRWLAQVAEGLAAIHENGLVHRDLKAENVLLTSCGDVKLLDFGLARAFARDEDVEAMTRSGMLLGTLRAMSPEQAVGGAVEVRSDLFSLGVLGHELLTGRSPFEAETPQETLRRILTFEPPPLSGSHPGLPVGLSALIQRLLEKSADQRPDSAWQVARELTSVSAMLLPVPTSTSVAEGLSRAPTVWPPRPVPGEEQPTCDTPTEESYRGPLDVEPASLRQVGRRGYLPWVAVLLLAAALMTWGLVSRSSTPSLRVALAEPLVIASGPENPAHLMAAAVREASLGALAQLQGIALIDPSQTRVVDGDAKDLALAVAADEVVMSEVSMKGERCHISLRRVRGADGSVVWSDAFEAPVGRRDLPMLAEAVAWRWQRAYSGRETRGNPGAPVPEEAYRRFLEIQSEIHDGGGRGALPQSQDLREILRSAPDFLAARLLAVDLELNLYTSHRQEDFLIAAKQDLRAAMRNAPQDPRTLYRAFRLAVIAGDFAVAAQRLVDFEHGAPGDVEVWVARAFLAESRGELRRAITFLEEAVAQHPSWANLYRLARLEQKTGGAASARHHLRQLLERWPESPWGLELLANLELQSGDLEAAESLLLRLLDLRPARPHWNNLGLVRFLRGRYTQAEVAYRAALDLDPGHPLVLLNLADCMWARDDRDAARQHYREVVDNLDQRATADGTSGYDSLLRAPSRIPMSGNEPKTDAPVSLSPYGGKLYMAYKQGKHPIGIAWYDGTWHGYTNSQHAIVNNANPKVDANKNTYGDDWVITSRGPSIANLASGGAERLYLAFKENGGESQVYFGSSDNPSDAASWSNLKRLGGDFETNGTPAVAGWNGKVVLVFPKASDHNRLYSAIFDPSQNRWSGLAPIKDGGSFLDPGNDKETSATNVTLIADDSHNRLFLSFGQDDHPRIYRLTQG